MADEAGIRLDQYICQSCIGVSRTSIQRLIGDGRVTLNGRVDSHEEVARAIRMAVEEDDVLEVTSTLQVSASGATAERPSGVEVAPQPSATPVP